MIRRLRYALARRIGRVPYLSTKVQWDDPTAWVTIRETYATTQCEGDRRVAVLLRCPWPRTDP